MNIGKLVASMPPTTLDSVKQRLDSKFGSAQPVKEKIAAILHSYGISDYDVEYATTDILDVVNGGIK